MTGAPMAGGKRRIDRVLAAEFREGLTDLDLDGIRERRDLCRQELQYLSFLRRLVQGRRDILQAELERRQAGEDGKRIVDRLAQVLADAPQGGSRGEAVTVPVPEEEISLARRRVEKLVSDARLSDLESLSDRDLEETIRRLDEEERTVSDARSRVIAVHDELQDQLKERYRARLSS